MIMPENLQKIFERDGRLKACTIICCADHGVSEEGVSAFDEVVTEQMVKNYLQEKGAAANIFSDYIKSDLIIVDVGVKGDIKEKGLLTRKIAFGTKNFTKGSAMTIEEAKQSIEVGKEIAKALSEGGYNTLLIGEMGISNTTAASAMTSMLLNVEPELVTGRGSNISEEKLKHKIEIIKKAIKVNGRSKEPIEVLSKVGGFEFGAMTGIIIGAYENQMVVMLDGFNTTVSALLAQRMNPKIIENVIATHIGREVGHKIILEEMNLKPLLALDLALGETVGSSIVYSLMSNLIGNEDDEEEIDDSDSDEEEEIDIIFEEENNTIKRPSSENIAVTDRTFNFYLNTMPGLDKLCMEYCNEKLDNLCKPKSSLGLLEEIAIQTAGISAESTPSDESESNIIYITDNIETELDDEYYCTTVANIKDINDISIAFDFGRTVAEDLSFKIPIIGITTSTDEEEELKQLLNEDGTLKYKEEEYFRHITKGARIISAGVTGAILAAAHNSSLVVVDNNSTEIIAKYLEKLCPEVKPFILHSTKILYNGEKFTNGEALKAGIEAVYAALTAINEMKTNEEVRVSKPIT